MNGMNSESMCKKSQVEIPWNSTVPWNRWDGINNLQHFWTAMVFSVSLVAINQTFLHSC